MGDTLAAVANSEDMQNQRGQKVSQKAFHFYAAKARHILRSIHSKKRNVCATRADEALNAVGQRFLEEGADCNVGRFLKEINLNVAAASTEERLQIDLEVGSFPTVLKIVLELANALQNKVFLYHPQKKEWDDISLGRLAPYFTKPTSSGCVELAVVSSNGNLIGRHSLSLWRPASNYFQNYSDLAPVKRVRRTGDNLIARAPVASSTVEPIDAVYTWVDSSDPSWRALYEIHAHQPLPDADRYEQTDELRYSLRSLEIYAPWVSRVFILSNCMPPKWFRPTDRFQWIMHDAIIPAEYLPTFNSHAIETFLHQIPGLAENFLYFNDDFFLADFVRRTDFFSKYGQSVSRLEPYGAVPYLRELCAANEAEEWQHAAVNGANLIIDGFSQRPTQLHRHAPYAFKKSVFTNLVHRWEDEVNSTRKAKFRSPLDVSAASFMYHHYALITGSAIEMNEESMIVRHTNYQSFLSKSVYKKLKFFCVNDGGGSSADTNFRIFKQQFLKTRYPFKTQAESAV